MEIRFKVKGDLWKDEFCIDVPDISPEAQALMNEVYRSKPLFGHTGCSTTLMEERIKIKLLKRGESLV